MYARKCTCTILTWLLVISLKAAAGNGRQLVQNEMLVSEERERGGEESEMLHQRYNNQTIYWYREGGPYCGKWHLSTPRMVRINRVMQVDLFYFIYFLILLS